MRKKTTWFGMTGILVIAVLLGAFSQSGEDLFQKALRLERNEGKLMEAIVLYNKVVADGGNESLAAQAQLRIGLCFEKMGQKSIQQAEEAFQKVLDNYPGQTEAVKLAKEKLKAIMKMQKPSKVRANELSLRKLWDGPSQVPQGAATGAPSPDGRYLSYIDWTSGNLAVHELKSRKNRLLTKDGSMSGSNQFPLGSSVWSMDSRLLAYGWLNPFSKNVNDLRIVEIEDAKPQILYQNQDVTYIQPFDWSPDGEFILVYMMRKSSAERLDVGLVSAKDGMFRILNIEGNRTRFDLGKAAFSPDGKFIAYTVDSNQESAWKDIVIFSLDKKQEIPLVEFPGIDYVLDWSPDGNYILFASDRTGTFDIWAQRIANGKSMGKPELIKKNMGTVVPLGITQDGSFYYCLGTGENDVFIASLDFEKGIILQPPQKATQRFMGTNTRPAFSPDGKFLSFSSRRSFGLKKLVPLTYCIQSVDTGKLREFIPDLISFGRGVWSPDGNFLLVDGKDKEEREGIYTIDVEAGTITPIVQVDSEINLIFPAWSHDGQKVFYTSLNWKKRNDYRIMMHDLENKTEREIYRWENAQPRFLTISPDGSTLAFVLVRWRSGSNSLNILSSAGGEPQELLRLEEKESILGGLAWTADGKGLVFAQAKRKNVNPKTELWRFSLENGKAQYLGLEMRQLSGLSIHPDGKRIAFKSGRPGMEVWVMENFLPKNK